MAQVKFLKGEQANLPEAITEGQVYFVTDERAIYLDVDAETRVRIGDFVEVNTLEELTAESKNLSTTALYYVKNLNALAKWDGSQLQQINPDTGATKVEVSGSGNAVDGATYDSASRTMKLTKGATFATSAEIKSSIGELGESSNVVDYITEKLAGLVSSEDITELEGKVTANEAAITKLNGEEADDGSVKKTVKDAIDALNLAETYAAASHQHTTAEITDLADKLNAKADADTVSTLSSTVTSIQGVVGATDGEGLQKKVSDLETKVSGLAGGMHFKGKLEAVPESKDDVAEYVSGDVIAVGNKEYVFIEAESPGEEEPKGKFEELGDTTALASQVSGFDSRLTAVEGKATKAETALNGINGTVKDAIDTAVEALKGSDEGVTAETVKGAVTEAKQYTDSKFAEIDLAEYAKTTDVESDIQAAKTELSGEIDTDVAAAKSEIESAYQAADTTTLTTAKSYADGLLAWGEF